MNDDEKKSIEREFDEASALFVPGKGLDPKMRIRQRVTAVMLQLGKIIDDLNTMDGIKTGMN